MRHGVSHRSATLFTALRATTSTCSALVYTVEVIYQIERVGLNPLQLLLAGTVLRLMSMIFQAPTGVLADLFGRRWAIAGGLLLMGSGFALEGVIPAFVVVLAAQVLWGLRGVTRLRERFFTRLDGLVGLAGRGLLVPHDTASLRRAAASGDL